MRGRLRQWNSDRIPVDLLPLLNVALPIPLHLLAVFPVDAERAGQLVKAATGAGALGFLRLGVLESVPMQASQSKHVLLGLCLACVFASATVLLAP